MVDSVFEISPSFPILVCKNGDGDIHQMKHGKKYNKKERKKKLITLKKKHNGAVPNYHHCRFSIYHELGMEFG